MEGSEQSELNSPVPSGEETVNTPSYVPRGAFAPPGGGRGRARETSASHDGTPLIGLSHREADDDAVVEHGGYDGDRNAETRGFTSLTDRPWNVGAATRKSLVGAQFGAVHGWRDSREHERDSAMNSGAFEDLPDAGPPRLEAAWPYADRTSQATLPGDVERECRIGLLHGQEGGDAPSLRWGEDRHAPASAFPAERWDHRGPVGRPGDTGGSERPREDQQRPSGRMGLDRRYM